MRGVKIDEEKKTNRRGTFDMATCISGRGEGEERGNSRNDVSKWPTALEGGEKRKREGSKNFQWQFFFPSFFFFFIETL